MSFSNVGRSPKLTNILILCRIRFQLEKKKSEFLILAKTCTSSNWHVNTSLVFFLYYFSKFAKKELEIKYQSLQLRITSSLKKN